MSILSDYTGGTWATLLNKPAVIAAGTNAAAARAAIEAASLVGGKIPEHELPALAITDVFPVASEAAMLALTAEKGDMAIRSDLNKCFALSAAPASTLANWLELKTPADAVLSVAGRTGVVTLTKTDVGLGNVDNTSDAAKSVASAATLTTARTINGVSFNGSANIVVEDTTKAPIAHVGSSGTAHAEASASVAGFMSAADKTKLNGIAAAATANATDASLRDRTTHTGAQAISTVTGLQTALDGKAPLNGTGTSGTWPISVTGSAAKITTARKINGKDFDGTADITISSVYDPTYTRMVSPAGGVFTTTNSVVTGAITIVLPVGMTNTMTRITVKIYEYTTNESFEVCFGGYNYTSGAWINAFAYIVGNPSINRNFTVRLGKRADGRAVAYIGELASTWSYPQVFVTDVQLGYGGMATWGSDWAIEFTTAAFESVTATISNSQIGYSAVAATANTLALRDSAGALAVGTLQATSAVQLLNGSAAQGMKVGSLTVSDSYANNPPSSGIYSKGVIQSGVATGTAPFTVASTTRVANLNVASAGVADSAATLTTARTINGVSFNGSANITVADSTKLPTAGGTMTGAITFAAGQTWPTFNQSTTGNAATATKLATARTINGVSFDGTSNITIADSTKLPLAGGTMTGAIAFAGGQTWPTFNQSTTGNAATATKLATARTINGVPFDGTANVTITAQPVFTQQHSDNTSNGVPFAAGVEYSLRVNGTYSRSTPVSPAIGDKFILNNLYNTWDSGLFTLARGSSAHKINNVQEDVVFNVNARRVELTYIYANEWIMAIS